MAYSVSIKDESQLICPQLHIGLTPGSGPANSHVSPCNRLKFKVPLSSLHSVRPLHSEEANLINAEPLSRLSCRKEDVHQMRISSVV